ncbi:putative HTH domain antitoxin [Methanococcus voltae]|uniref:hypothetical protein n=1 Tax=Methanococcus voltae TaxID=2188 RepID=UPI001AEA117E|nr:hypothetical protein [Methanococcus voltae]MBP2143896.1 putative HTH domain antitoxin [Methanococcus voltae]
MEDYVKIADSLVEEEQIVLYILGTLNNQKIKSRLKLQKLLFLTSKVVGDRMIELFDIIPYNYGPFSCVLPEIIDNLISLNLIDMTNLNKKNELLSYKLSKKGHCIYNILSSKETLEDNLISNINSLKEFLNDLSDNEIMVYVYNKYPEYAEKSINYNELYNKRINYAIKLLKKEKINFETALSIANIENEEFTILLNEKKIKTK